jgi:hypothetical protein
MLSTKKISIMIASLINRKIKNTSMLIFLVIAALLILPAFSVAQSETVYMETYIDGNRFIYLKMTITGQLKDNNQLMFNFIPKFMEQEQILGQKQISRYKLNCVLNPANITIQPSNYFSLSGKDQKIHSITEQSILTFEPLVDEFKHDTLRVTFKFNVSQAKETVEGIAKIKIALPVSEEYKASVSKPTPASMEIVHQPLVEPLKKKSADELTSNESAGKQEETPPSTSDINELVLVVNELKALHQLLYDLKAGITEKTIDQMTLNQHYMTAERLKAKFETKYLNETYANPEAVDRIFKLFNQYFTSIEKLILELSKEVNVLQTKESMVKNSESGENTEKSDVTRMILYFIIFLAVIVFIFAVVVLLMKKQKNKKQINLQQQMQRKVQTEMNKQKFQASQQKNKFKI